MYKRVAQQRNRTASRAAGRVESKPRSRQIGEQSARLWGLTNGLNEFCLNRILFERILSSTLYVQEAIAAMLCVAWAVGLGSTRSHFALSLAGTNS